MFFITNYLKKKQKFWYVKRAFTLFDCMQVFFPLYTIWTISTEIPESLVFPRKSLDSREIEKGRPCRSILGKPAVNAEEGCGCGCGSGDLGCAWVLVFRFHWHWQSSTDDLQFIPDPRQSGGRRRRSGRKLRGYTCTNALCLVQW